MNRYIVHLYAGKMTFSYPISAETAEKAYKRAETHHAKMGRKEPDSMSISFTAATRPKLQARGIK